MILRDVGMLAAPTARTTCYLQAMLARELLPAWVLYLDDGAPLTRPADVRPATPVPGLLAENGIPFVHLPFRDPNAPAVVDAVTSCQPRILIYSGPSRGILRGPMLATGKRFLHVHPGLLPDFRGSTTIYYALLMGRGCGVSAFFLNGGIDTGDIIRTRSCPPPADRTSIDLEYDPKIRAEMLIEVLQEYVRCGEFATAPQCETCGETYHIIHPVLKHIAILGVR